MRSWMTLALIVGLAPSSVPSVRADEPADMARELGRLNGNVEALKAQLNKIESDLKTESVTAAGGRAQLRELHDRIGQLERQVADVINARSSSTTRNYYAPGSNYYTPGNTDVVNGPPLNRGVIRLENRYSVPVTVYVNGRAYSVPAYASREVLGMPAGMFTYEIMAEGFGVIQPQVARTLAANGSHNIYINPPTMVALP